MSLNFSVLNSSVVQLQTKRSRFNPHSLIIFLYCVNGKLVQDERYRIPLEVSSVQEMYRVRF